MSKAIEDGGPAFPMPAGASAYDGRPNHSHGPVFGMTLRDYFAAAALQSLYCAVPSHWNDAMSPNAREIEDGNWRGELARRAYQMADAMLAARESNS